MDIFYQLIGFAKDEVSYVKMYVNLARNSILFAITKDATGFIYF
jgi:hypothetical protein